MLSYEHKLKQREGIINDLERYASYFRGKYYFDGNDGAQNIFILGHDLTQKVNNTTIYAEKTYSPNFSAENKFCLSLRYNGGNSYLFVNGKEVT